MPEKTQNRLQFLINLAYIAAIAVLAYLGYKYVLGWVLPFILALAIVSILNPVIRFVNSKLKFTHKAASITVMVLVYGLTGYLLFILIMQGYYALRNLFTVLPGYYDSTIAPVLTNIGNRIGELIDGLPRQWSEEVYNLQGELMNAIQSLLVSVSQAGMGAVTNFAGHIPSFAIAFVFTIMLSFFVGTQYKSVTAFIMAQLPPKAKDVIRDMRGVVNDIVLRYLAAIIKLMFITFVELAIGLLILRTKNAIVIAAGIAVFDALPLLGTGAIVIPWVLIELLQGNYAFALGLGILYAIVTVVRNIIEPHIVGQKLGLNPIVSIVSIYLGYKVMGVFGMIIMPIVTQIVLELHKRGVIRLYKSGQPAPAEGPGEDGAEPPPDPGQQE